MSYWIRQLFVSNIQKLMALYTRLTTGGQGTTTGSTNMDEKKPQFTVSDYMEMYSRNKHVRTTAISIIQHIADTTKLNTGQAMVAVSIALGAMLQEARGLEGYDQILEAVLQIITAHYTLGVKGNDGSIKKFDSLHDAMDEANKQADDELYGDDNVQP